MDDEIQGVAPDMPTEIPATPKRPYTDRGAYPAEFRDGAVRMVVEDGMSTTEVADKLKVRRALVTTWVRVAGYDKKARKAMGEERHPPPTPPARPQVASDVWEVSLMKEKLAQVVMEIEMLKKMLILYMGR